MQDVTFDDQDVSPTPSTCLIHHVDCAHNLLLQNKSLGHLKDAMEELCRQMDITTLNPVAVQAYCHTLLH